MWENITPPQVPIGGANNLGVVNVVANPLAPGEIFVASNQKGIFKSSDCGSTWTKVNTGANAAVMDSGTAFLFVMDPITPNVMYADTFQGSQTNIFKTTNGGADWNPTWAAGGLVAMATEYLSPELASIDPTNHLHIVVGIHANCKAPYNPMCLAESTDGGGNWHIVNGPSEFGGWIEDAAPVVVNATTILIGSAFKPLYVTQDGGGTWSKVAGSGGLRGLTTNGWTYMGAAFNLQRSKDLVNWTDLQNTPGEVGFGIVSDDKMIYAASRYHTLYAKSPVTDGANWTSFPAPPNLVNPMTDGAYSLAIDTTHNILYSASQASGLYRMLTR
jgi:photosystem II stability/assembly factor-like uncharacterized protein